MKHPGLFHLCSGVMLPSSIIIFKIQWNICGKRDERHGFSSFIKRIFRPVENKKENKSKLAETGS
jgi:Ni,Fe-hydrogenase I cytochrome b subunit